MRIISGTLKGKRITAPKKLPARPTTDMAKEGLFNILNNRYCIEDCVILDLFAGTGNISYEFASRGSKNITAIDSNANCIKFIEKTSKELNFNVESIKSDVFKYLKITKAEADIIFADPPYALPTEDFKRIIELVFENHLLVEDGMLIIEHSSHTELSNFDHFEKKRKYGGSVFSFFPA